MENEVETEAETICSRVFIAVKLRLSASVNTVP